MAWGDSGVLVVLTLWPGVVSPASSPTLNVTALGATLSVTDREWLAVAAAKVQGYDVLNMQEMHVIWYIDGALHSHTAACHLSQLLLRR
jgi:hypothetical protein